MDSVLSKFNLYELFRILLPGFYFIYIFYKMLGEIFITEITQKWFLETALVYFILSLLAGTIIYSFDLGRLFKNHIKNLPTKLMSEKYPQLYPPSKQRKNEHIYYEWYENAKTKSRIKTELQSGLYHLSINFVFVSILAAFVLLIQCQFNGDLFFINSFILLFSVLSSIFIIKYRLSHQWKRNFWQFEKEIIKKNKRKK